MGEWKIHRTCIAADSASLRSHTDEDSLGLEEADSGRCGEQEGESDADRILAGIQPPEEAEVRDCDSSRPSCPTCRCCIAAPLYTPYPFSA